MAKSSPFHNQYLLLFFIISLPIKSLASIFKSFKISGLLLLRDSKDPLVSGNKPNLKSVSWNANGAVRSAESELNFRKLRGPTQFGRAGIGTTSHKPIPNDKHSHEYRKLISKTSKEIDEESQLARALQLQVQCQWTRWDNYEKNDLSWTFVLDTPPNMLSFCLASTYDVLPSLSNLKRFTNYSMYCCIPVTVIILSLLADSGGLLSEDFFCFF